MTTSTKSPAATESPAYLRELERLFEVDEPGQFPRLIGADGTERTLTADVATALHEAIRRLRAAIEPPPADVSAYLTTEEAADLLGVLHPYLLGLLDQGQLPFVEEGSQRRIRRHDLVTYRDARDQTRRQALRKLSALSQGLGLYDLD
jgi:excisionase family DNA binding protein